MGKAFLFSISLAALLCFASMGSGQEAIEINYQMPYAGPHVLNLEFHEPWAKAMQEKSDGRLIFHTFMNGAIFRGEEAVSNLQNGTIDITSFMATFTDHQFPHSLVFNIPYISRDSVHASALYWKAYTEIPQVYEEYNRPGKLLTLWGSDRSGIFSTTGPVLSPADMRGKRVLIWTGGQVDQVKSWGGIPVQVSANDTYMALQRGMGEIFFGPLPTGVAYKLMEVAKDITIFPASSLMIGVAMNWDLWEELEEDLQELIMSEMGEAACIRSGRMLYDATNRDLDTMRAEGCTIHTMTPAQMQAFRDADSEVIMNFWVNDLKRLGIKDPQALIKQAYDLSTSITIDGETSE